LEILGNDNLYSENLLEKGMIDLFVKIVRHVKGGMSLNKTDIKKYITIHHRWIIGILVALLIPLLIYALLKYDNERPKTEAYYFVPSDNDIQISSKKADCWTASISSIRSDAYRCSVDNGIHDPCFIDPFHESEDAVICPSNPYDKDAYIGLAKIEKRNELNDKNYESYPWYIELQDGSGCHFMTGATTTMADMRMDYGCDSDSFLLLPIERTDQVMTIGCYKNNRIEKCQIKEAWY